MSDAAEIHAYLSEALAKTWLISTASDPLGEAFIALDALMLAATRTDDLLSIDPVTCAQLAEALRRATPVIANAVVRFHPEEYVYLQMAAVVGLLNENSSELQRDRLLHLVGFRSELCAHVCRREISKRGDPLVRAITINRALAVEHASHMLQ